MWIPVTITEVWSLSYNIISYNKSVNKFKGDLEESLRSEFSIHGLKAAVFSILMQVLSLSITSPLSDVIAVSQWGPLCSMMSLASFRDT